MLDWWQQFAGAKQQYRELQNCCKLPADDPLQYELVIYGHAMPTTPRISAGGPNELVCVEDEWQRRHGSLGRKARLDGAHYAFCLAVCLSVCLSLSLCYVSIIDLRPFVLPAFQRAPVTSNTCQLRHTSLSSSVPLCAVNSTHSTVLLVMLRRCGPNWTSVSGLRDHICDADSQRQRCTVTCITKIRHKGHIHSYSALLWSFMYASLGGLRLETALMMLAWMSFLSNWLSPN